MTYPEDGIPIQIGLALSGGGVRAAAFHAGVLRYLAEQNRLEQVVQISSVSGGSLFTGLVLSLAGYKWPTSQDYLENVLPKFREQLTARSLQLNAILRLFFYPCNWRFILSRANVLAQTIELLWNISAPLSRLPDTPVWSINGTTAENGKRFRFKAGTLGDYELGYAQAQDFPLAQAMAVSAAFPGGIGPLSIKTTDFQWTKKASWDAEKASDYTPPFGHLHLYDGGVYDNLGIEPIFDGGKQALKVDGKGRPNVEFLLVSDAGAPLAKTNIPNPLNPFRFKRIADIASDQTRALRVRAFVNFLQKNPGKGAYLGIGARPTDSIRRLEQGRDAVAAQLLQNQWLSSEQVSSAATLETSLKKLPTNMFDLLARHGYETAKWNMELMVQETPPSK